MSLKVKLISTIAAVCMVICLLSVGIWAASVGTVNVGGTVSFVAEDVDVTITATVTGSKTTGQTRTITWDAGTAYNADGEDEDDVANDALVADWTDLVLDFQKNTPIVIEITITNNSEQRSVGVAISDNGSNPTNWTHGVDKPADTLEYIGATAGEIVGEQATAASNVGTYTITLTGTDWNELMAGTLNYKVVVTNIA